MTERDETRIPGGRAGEQVGLGRVVEDRLSTGSPDRDDPGATGSTRAGDARRGGAGTTGRDPDVEEASQDSFPASDPPTFMSDPATPAEPATAADRGRDATEAPASEDVP